ncbi:ABC transporter ATP-binding protein [Ferruginivarius sediminum]|uniref:ABC transporter ATP-binding protein n=1 Tax=Ferruginivarius sediminum TaxID=2661937 RepID=A0A369THC1_9PROT|nr:ABC transporter ATP-binding protein [Ferruginivarius sediminum]RDD63775.1 ABC transporter ATP-binding protein [Ferruginivarius sediminum]
MSLLTVENIRAGYGDVDILNGVQMRVDRGEIVVIIGPNGAGKSTVMKTIFGLVKVREGRIVFEDKEITNLRPDQVVRAGLCYVPQEKNVFPTLTVEENLEMGAFIRNDDFSKELQKVYELFPAMYEKRRQPAGALSGGQRQMVAMGRALMLDPRLILLDEPTAGLAPAIVDLMFDNIQKINGLGVSILMVEQNAKQALAMSHRGYVLATGRNRFEDTGRNLLANREVAEMFLGG